MTEPTAQDMVNALMMQRNSAQNEAAKLKAMNDAQERRIAELEAEVKSLKDKNV